VTTKVIMAAIINQAARKFNVDEADGVNRRHTRHRPLTPSAALFALFLTGLWSGLGVAIKFGLEDAPPLRLGWLRFVLGALTVLVWALWVRADLVPKRGEAPALLAVGT
jgi:hypothetical protein